MTRITEAELPTIDLFSPEFSADPWPHIERARTSSWVARTTGGLMVLDYDMVRDFFKDRRLVGPGTAYLEEVLGLSEGPFFDFFSNMVLNLEGDRHARIRRVMTKAFTPQAADHARPMIRQVLREVLDRVAPQGFCEFVADVCDTYPLTVLCRLIGFDERDIPDIGHHCDTLGLALTMDPAIVPALNQAAARLFGYADQIISERRANPRDDHIQLLVEMSEDDEALTQAELRVTIVHLLAGGFDTTKQQLGLCMYQLCREPELYERLADDWHVVASTVEESLRYLPVIGTAVRVAATSFDYGEYTIPQGTMFLLSCPAAGRDPKTNADPDSFDGRRKEATHVTFGAGHHLCTGIHLARAELQEALRAVASRVKSPRMTGEVMWRAPLGIAGLKTLPLTFTPECS